MASTIGDVITPGNEKAFTVRDTKPGALQDLAPQYKKLLSDPVTASLTTLSEKGEMQVTPVWVGNDGTYLELNSVRGRLKDRNLRRNGKVTLLFMNPANPYHWMSIKHTVAREVSEDDPVEGPRVTEHLDKIWTKYTGNPPPYGLRDPAIDEKRVLFICNVDRIATFGKP